VKDLSLSSKTTPTAWISDKQLSFVVLTTLTAGMIFLTYLIFRPFLAALFMALVMAIAFFPLNTKLARLLRNTNAAALITTVVAIIVILVPLALVGTKLAVEFTSFSKSILQDLGRTSTWPTQFDSAVEYIAEHTGMPVEQLKADVAARARELGSYLVGFATSMASNFVKNLITVLFGALFLFSILRNSDELRSGALSILPISPERAHELATVVSRGIVANIYGMFTVGLTEGALIAIGFWLTGLRSPLLWGAIAVVLSFLPVVGVSLVWVPGCILLAMRGNWTFAILLFVWGVLVVATADGILRCRVVSGRVKVNPLLITLALMGGVSVFGPIGFFAGPVVVVLLVSLIRILREEHASVYESRQRVA
jgi:predicted PurR-regulated permease PerM